MRINNVTSTASTGQIFATGIIQLRQTTSTKQIFWQDQQSNAACSVDLTSIPDAIVRFQRDYAHNRVTCEVWSIQGGSYALTTNTNGTMTSLNLSGGWSWGGTVTNLYLGYFRVSKTIVGPSSTIPNPNVVGSTGSLLDYEMSGNTLDSSSNAVNISGWSSGPSFNTNPNHPPVISLNATPTTVRVGSSFSLDASNSYPLDGGTTLTVRWNQTNFVPLLNTSAGAVTPPMPNAFLGTAQTSLTASPTLTLAGTYYLVAQATDGSGQSASQSFKVGAVATDANNIVVIPDPRMDYLLGPLTMLGSSPWPWYDGVMAATGLTFGTNVPSGPPFIPTISGSPGTISVTNCASTPGGCAITGSGTAFQTDFACDGTDAIVIYYKLLNGQTGARPYWIGSCSSQTSMTVVQGQLSYVSSRGGYDATDSCGPPANDTAQCTLHYDKFIGGGTNFIVSTSYPNQFPVSPSQNGSNLSNAGNYSYTANSACTSGSSAVAWGQTIGGTTTTGTCTWTNIGVPVGNWVTTNNYNYYDCVLALYRTYFRTGLDTYLTIARSFGTSWYIFPWDGGRAVNNSGIYQIGGPTREAAAFGLMALALDGNSGMWLDSAANGAPATTGYGSGIRGMVDSFYESANAFFYAPYDLKDSVDVREPGYTLQYLAKYYMLYDQFHGGSYYSTMQSFTLGAMHSLSYHNNPTWGFTVNADPFSASGGNTAYGGVGINYTAISWLNPLIFGGLIDFINAAGIAGQPSDQASALSLLQTTFDEWWGASYIYGSYPSGSISPTACNEIAYGSNGFTNDSAHMPINCPDGCPPGTVTVASLTGTNVNVTGSGTAFLTGTDAKGHHWFLNDGTDWLGVEWNNISSNGIGGYSSCFPPNCNYNNIKVVSISDDTHMVIATGLGVNQTVTGGNCTLCSLSGLSYGQSASAVTGVGISNLPQNYYSNTLDPPSGGTYNTCATTPVYGMGGRDVAELAHRINGYLYLNAPSGNAAYKNQGDRLFTAAFGCGTSTTGCAGGSAANIPGGGPGADSGAGGFADILVSGWNFSTGFGKPFGAVAGAGQADSYLAYRLGGLAASTPRTKLVYFNLSAVASAAKVSITITNPSGISTTTVCTSSPCAVTAEGREGDYTRQIAWLTSGNAVIVKDSPLPFVVN